MDTQQLEFSRQTPYSNSLTVSDWFDFFWAYYYKDKACAKSDRYNRIALCRTFGGVRLAELNELDVMEHLRNRETGWKGQFEAVGGQTMAHDIRLLVLLLNVGRKWIRKRFKLGGYDFGQHVPIPDPRELLEDIDRPKGSPCLKVPTPDEWAVFTEHAPARLLERAYFMVDTGLQECDLRKLKITDYDGSRDAWLWKRRKNRERAVLQVIPVSDRCRPKLREAIRTNSEFILDWTNHQNEWRKIRRKLKIRWTLRSLRKVHGNIVKKLSGNSDAAGQKALGHKSRRTFTEWYDLDDGGDLRPAINGICEQYPGRPITAYPFEVLIPQAWREKVSNQ